MLAHWRDLLEDLDSYLEDINDRLTISRMVSNSVIKGMVNVVAQEANEKIAMKNLEVAGLKEALHFCHVDADETDPFRLRESLGNLKSSAREQFKKLQKEISGIRGSSPMRRINSSSEVGLCGILQEKASEKWTDVDKTIDTLMTTLDTVTGSFKEKLKLWRSNILFEVFGKSLKRDCGIRMLIFVLISHGSCEIGEEWNNTKGTNHFHRKVLSNHVSPATSVWEGNGKHEESKTSMPENLESSSLLKHMSKEDLFNHFKTEMTKMRRNHESQVQEMVEQYISLKGKFLKERGSSLPL
ncbi:WPP domain-associated protein [Vitis vinifera]|uniref:WPP domain-associated protein n=1 Tax=Vitis vinifera TaxID=29760 RepID=A0A438F7Q3_VITVI|nr:WPP domain-associated protein [Vitis vinifera]